MKGILGMYETDYIVKHYTPADSDTRSEDDRLTSKHGSVEFLTTMRYIEKYLKPGDRIIEIGAATGRYSHTLHMREEINAMDEETFELYLRYHFSICERPDMIGLTHHSLDIFRNLQIND